MKSSINAHRCIISCSPAPSSGQPSTIPEYYIPPAPPPPPPTIPSAQTAFDAAAAPPCAVPPTSSALSRPYSPSPPPPPANYVPSPAHPPSGAPPAAPPPPPPGAPLGLQAHPSPPAPHGGQQAVDAAAPVSRKSTMMGMIPMSDARSDLLAAIRRGEWARVAQGLHFLSECGEKMLLVNVFRGSHELEGLRSLTRFSVELRDEHQR